MPRARCTPSKTQDSASQGQSGPADGLEGGTGSGTTGARDAILEEHASLSRDRTSRRVQWPRHVARRGECSTSASRGRRALPVVGRAGPAYERQEPETPLFIDNIELVDNGFKLLNNDVLVEFKLLIDNIELVDDEFIHPNNDVLVEFKLLIDSVELVENELKLLNVVVLVEFKLLINNIELVDNESNLLFVAYTYIL